MGLWHVPDSAYYQAACVFILLHVGEYCLLALFPWSKASMGWKEAQKTPAQPSFSQDIPSKQLLCHTFGPERASDVLQEFVGLFCADHKGRFFIHTLI